jgi:hypothetical protein
VKPGSCTSGLFESAKVAAQLTHDDMIVICSGTNDCDLNELSRTFRNINDITMHNNHTDILLINVPFRYDFVNCFAVNGKISVLNKNCRNQLKFSSHKLSMDYEQQGTVY